MNSIPVIRRITGGGTVFHDRGNLNFTFIAQSEPGRQIDFRKYTAPVIDYLATLGISACFGGKNDLKVDGFKISGNAEHVYRNRVLHHGTLLFSSSLGILRNAIRKDPSHYITRAVASNPSPVMNLSDKLKLFGDISRFKSEMMGYFLAKLPGALTYELSFSDRKEAEELALSKYKTWEWNYAYGPEYRLNKSIDLSNCRYSLNMFVKDGIIADCEIIGQGLLHQSGAKLTGCRHMASDIMMVLNRHGIAITEEELYLFF
jgi:lipoate-protein ligase A